MEQGQTQVDQEGDQTLHSINTKTNVSNMSLSMLQDKTWRAVVAMHAIQKRLVLHYTQSVGTTHIQTALLYNFLMR